MPDKYAINPYLQAVSRMTEGSHHEYIRVSGRIVGHIRITNSGKILSVWFKEPYNQLFLPEIKEEEE